MVKVKTFVREHEFATFLNRLKEAKETEIMSTHVGADPAGWWFAVVYDTTGQTGL